MRSFVVIAALLLLACSSEENKSSSSKSAASSTATTGGGGTSMGGMGGMGGSPGGMGGMGGSPCSTHDQLGQEVEITMVAQDRPAAMGGVIQKGTYVLTELARYTGPMGMTGPTNVFWTETQVWTDVDMQTIAVVPGEGELRLQFAYSLGDGTGSISMNVLCPGSLQVPWTEYSTMGDQLILYSPDLGFTFERQPDP